MATGTSSSIKLVVNGLSVTTAVVTLADLVAELGHDAKRVATAVNGDFVAAKARDFQALKSGDRVEIVSARQGG